MKEKEARAKFRQVRKEVFNFVLLILLVMYIGQRHKLHVRVYGVLRRKILASLYFLQMENWKRNLFFLNLNLKELQMVIFRWSQIAKCL